MMDRQEILAKAKPILFNTEMVKAILDNRKTVTRRVIKPKYCDSVFEMHNNVLCETEPYTEPIKIENGMSRHKIRRFIECKSRYKVGDILYVRETWRKHPKQDIFYYRADSVCNGKSDEWGCPEPYDKTNNCILCEWCDGFIKWRPSIHMPKEAARIFLRVTGVKVERLQDITTEECHKEGVCEKGTSNFGTHYNPVPYDFSLEKFETLWDSTIKKQYLDIYGWEANPWVWTYEFERVNVDG